MPDQKTITIRVRFNDFLAIKNTPFDQIPFYMRLQIFGVEYVCLDLPDCGQLFVTRHGWPLLDFLLPKHWFEDRQYARRGRRLPGSTGNVYMMPSRTDRGECSNLVVKFCRFAQHVPLHFSSPHPTAVQGDIDAARFNSPFEEFGLLMDLRRGCFGPKDLRIRTKHPLAIFCPQERYRLWQLGRNPALFQSHQNALIRDQFESGALNPVKLDVNRIYIMLFGWVEGMNAEAFYDQGLLEEKELRELTYRVTEELKCKGFYVLDNKPKHFILRQARGRDGLLRRHGKLVYLLVDFELLLRTHEYEAFLRQDKHERLPFLVRAVNNPA